MQELQKRLFWSLVFASAVLLGLYVYFVNATVMNIVGRKSAEQEATTINSTIAGLESRYLALAGSITPEYAHSLGFAEAQSETYAARRTYAVAYAAEGGAHVPGAN